MLVCRRVWVFGAVLIATACGGGSVEAPPPAPVPVRPVPAGVDSTTAMEVDSIADASFVSEDEEAQAFELQEEARLIVERTDSMWTVMSELIEAQEAVSEADSVEARDAATASSASRLWALKSSRAAHNSSAKACACSSAAASCSS